MPKPTPTPNDVPNQLSIRLPGIVRGQLADLLRRFPGSSITAIVIQAIAALWQATQRKGGGAK